jgi:hypothetical protein
LVNFYDNMTNGCILPHVPKANEILAVVSS